MSKAFRITDGPSSGVPRCLFLALAVALSACTKQNGVIGSEPLATAPDSGPLDAGPAAPAYRTDFDTVDNWISENDLPGSSTTFGVQVTGAVDPSTAELRFPGHPGYAADGGVGPNGSLTQIESPQRFGFGTYRTRVQFGNCKTTEETVNAALGYFRDGSDTNQNGITDDLEIDFQVLCGTPQNLYLTVFTDYDSDTQFRQLSHVIDFSTGNLYDTPSASQSGFTLTSNDPAFLNPSVFAAGTFYEVGFEWHSSSLRFFMVLNGVEQTLWTLSDPTHIPQQPVSFLYNLWHPATHWFPASTAADFPAIDVIMHVDWFEYYMESP